MKKIAIALLLAAGFTGCAKEQPAPSPLPADGVIRIEPTVGDTRSAMTTDKLSEFGVFINNSNGNSTYTYANNRVYKQDGKWLNNKQMLWQNASTAVQVIAYSPYKSSFEFDSHNTFTCALDQSGATGVEEQDLIYARADAISPNSPGTAGDMVFYNATTKSLNLNFKHRLSLLRLEVVLGSEFNPSGVSTVAENPITWMRINGAKNLYSWTPATDEFGLGVQKTSITPREYAYTPGTGTALGSPMTSASASYECIIPPQTIAASDFSIDIMVNNSLYTWTSSKDEAFERNKAHTLRLLVGQDVVTLGSHTIQPWTDGLNSTVETD